MQKTSISVKSPLVKRKPFKTTSLHRQLSDDDQIQSSMVSIAGLNDHDSGSASSSSQEKPWLPEFSKYLDMVEHVPDSMSIIQWWGVSFVSYYNKQI